MDEVKICVSCKISKPIIEFLIIKYRRINKDGTVYYHEYRKNKCRKCLNKLTGQYRKERFIKDPNYYKDCHNKYWLKNKEKILFSKRKKSIILRLKVIKLLGSKCVGWNNQGCPFNCGNSDCEEELIQVDHIIPLNISGKKRIFNDGRYNDVIKNLKEYQLLCSNCHLKKSNKELKEYWEMKRNGLS